MKKIIVVACVSFTVVALGFGLAQGSGFAPPLSGAVLFQLLVMVLSVSFVMYLAERFFAPFEMDSLIIDLLVRIFICYIVVLGECILFDLVPMAIESLLLISPVMVPAFFISYAINYFILVNYAKEINDAIGKQSGTMPGDSDK